MENLEQVKEEILLKARELIAELEAGNEEKVSSLLENISKLHESSLFSELGKLTRELHNAISSFHLDVRLTDIAEQEIPDAKERLNYVIDMTDKSAHKVLNLVEDSLPLADDVCSTAHALQELWRRFMAKDMSVEEFREVAFQLKDFFVQVEDSSKQLKSNLSEVVMAQDYQDLTGQIIRRVINLVQDVENNLVNLIRISGGEQLPSEPVPERQLAGPAVPNVDTEDQLSGQDDVDDLLSSLGF